MKPSVARTIIIFVNETFDGTIIAEEWGGGPLMLGRGISPWEAIIDLAKKKIAKERDNE